MSPASRERILILCTGNSARSQMAEGLLRRGAGERFEILSAGLKPGRVRPEGITVMDELGIDISYHRSKSVDEFTGQEFGYVITVCDNASEACPVFPGNTRRLHWSFEDPAAVEGPDEVRLAAFRRIRDQIANRIERVALELHLRRRGSARVIPGQSSAPFLLPRFPAILQGIARAERHISARAGGRR